MPTLEERVAHLESEFKVLKKSSTIDRPWWEERFGAFAEDALYDEAMKAAAEYRKAQIPDYMKDDPSSDVRA